MKLNKLFLAGVLLAFGLTSCNKEDNGINNNQNVGDTYMSVSMDLPQNSRESDQDHNPIGDYYGVDKINSLTVYIADAASVEVVSFNSSELGGNGYTWLQTSPFKVKSGSKTVFAVVNITDDIKEALASATDLATLKAKYEAAYTAFAAGKEIAKLEGEQDVIMMTGESVTQEILPNISAANAAASNAVTVQVKRAAARVSVTITATEHTEYIVLPTKGRETGVYPIMAKLPDGGEKLLATLSDLQWSVGQYELKYNLKQNSPVLSPAATYVPANTGDYQSNAGTHYDYSTLQNRIPVQFLDHPYSLLDVPTVKYKYISETTHADGDYRKGNTAYVLVRGKLTPADDMWGDLIQETKKEREDDIFFGLTTLRFYKSEEAATNAGNDKVITYKGGYV